MTDDTLDALLGPAEASQPLTAVLLTAGLHPATTAWTATVGPKLPPYSGD